ncbi:flap endonuclease-1 [Candidatus Woesearchaeota archaeon]|nr:flap endonuclease-1 [Candidatus Woesearchaeota archaeon]
MGVNISELLLKKEIEIASLRNRIIAVDAHLFLYQFLTTIRQRDGGLLMDSHGRVTSHLTGLFTRNAKLMQQGLRLCYVFDGKSPELKMKERQKRRQLKEDASVKYEEAKAKKDLDEMKKYAARTSKLSSDMIEEAKKLLAGMGIPVIVAPSEAEAQAAYIVKQGKAFASASQDADSLMFGCPKLIRNLSFSGKRKKSNKLAYEAIKPEIVNLSDTLNSLGIDQEQLIALCMLVGTDFNNKGIKGIGPKKAVELVKKYGNDFDNMFKDAKWDDNFEIPWNEVYYLIKKMPVSDDYFLNWDKVNRDKVYEILVEEHDFSEERVNSTLDKISAEKEKQTQKDLGEFL